MDSLVIAAVKSILVVMWKKNTTNRTLRSSRKKSIKKLQAESNEHVLSEKCNQILYFIKLFVAIIYFVPILLTNKEYFSKWKSHQVCFVKFILFVILRKNNVNFILTFSFFYRRNFWTGNFKVDLFKLDRILKINISYKLN